MDDESPRVGAEILAGGTADLKPARVSPAFFGAVPGHPILDRALDDMRPRSQYGHDKAATGSVFFDRLMKHYPDTVSFEAGLFIRQTMTNASGRSPCITGPVAGRPTTGFGTRCWRVRRKVLPWGGAARRRAKL